MQNKKPFGILIYSVFFIVLGIIWICTIYQRNNIIIPEKEKPYIQKQKINIVNYKALVSEMKEVVNDKKNKQIISRESIIVMWVIVVLEVICAMMYIFSGFSLLRNYPGGNKIAIFTIFLDSIFKISINVIYYNIKLFNIGFIIDKKLVSHFFMLKGSSLSVLSGNLTGISFFETNNTIFLFAFILYVFGSFYFFTKEDIQRYFSNKK